MYQLIKGLVKPVGQNTRFFEMDIGSVPLTELFRQYQHVFAILSHNSLPYPVCLILENIKQQYLYRTITFNQMLAEVGNNALPTTKDIPELKTEYFKFFDLFRCGFTIEPVHPELFHSDAITDAEKTWLHLSKDKVDYHKLHASSLVTVNGYIHLTDVDRNGLYVVDGMRSGRHSRNNQIGMINTINVCNLTFHPFQQSSFHKREADVPYSKHLFFDVDFDVENKTVFVVIGGYLHALDPKVLRRVADRTFRISFQNIPLLDRYYDSKDSIDLSSLPFDRDPDYPERFKVQDFFSDEVIQAWLLLSQSFIVVADSNELFRDSQHVETSPMPGIAKSYIPALYPMIDSRGGLVEYWTVEEDGQHSINYYGHLNNQYLFNTTPLSMLKSVTDQRVPAEVNKIPRLQFLMIGKDL